MQAEKLGSEGLCLLWWSSPNNATKTPRTCTTHSTGTWVSSSQQKVAAILEEEAAVAHFCTHCQHLYLKHKETLSSPSLTPGKERLCHSHGLRQKAAHMAVSAMCSLGAFSASLDKIKNLKEFNFFSTRICYKYKKKKLVTNFSMSKKGLHFLTLLLVGNLWGGGMKSLKSDSWTDLIW